MASCTQFSLLCPSAHRLFTQRRNRKERGAEKEKHFSHHIVDRFCAFTYFCLCLFFRVALLDASQETHSYIAFFFIHSLSLSFFFLFSFSIVDFVRPALISTGYPHSMTCGMCVACIPDPSGLYVAYAYLFAAVRMNCVCDCWLCVWLCLRSRLSVRVLYMWEGDVYHSKNIFFFGGTHIRLKSIQFGWMKRKARQVNEITHKSIVVTVNTKSGPSLGQNVVFSLISFRWIELDGWIWWFDGFFLFFFSIAHVLAEHECVGFSRCFAIQEALTRARVKRKLIWDGFLFSFASCKPSGICGSSRRWYASIYLRLVKLRSQWYSFSFFVLPFLSLLTRPSSTWNGIFSVCLCVFLSIWLC